ncbi:hypothetical protein HPB51_010590 [Rhipicephalus microplus]|uniref:Uncharacterized protein n=1 Tax=Rhipicephalus microplus TaxID=6941 RepID=A0A9J6E977_RHIMP|nr:hypothetical protein HPB51_010590 [Rhipicephalus microplus]
MKLKGFSLRSRTGICEKLPEEYKEKRHSFQRFVLNLRHNNGYLLGQIGNANQTPLYFDMPVTTTVEKKGAKQVRVLTSGHVKTSDGNALLHAKGPGVTWADEQNEGANGQLDLASLLHAPDWRLATTVRRKSVALPSIKLDDSFEGCTGDVTFVRFPNGSPHPRRHRRSRSTDVASTSASPSWSSMQSNAANETFVSDTPKLRMFEPSVHVEGRTAITEVCKVPPIYWAQRELGTAIHLCGTRQHKKRCSVREKNNAEKHEHLESATVDISSDSNFPDCFPGGKPAPAAGQSVSPAPNEQAQPMKNAPGRLVDEPVAAPVWHGLHCGSGRNCDIF